METYKICISKSYFNFAAAHFIVFRDNVSETTHPCERLHGHNYRFGIELTGKLDKKNGYIVDFIIVKNIASKILGELDHQILIPTKNQLVKTEQKGRSIEVNFRKNDYTLPVNNVKLLPILNITTEMLASYFAKRIIKELKKEGINNIDTIEIEIEESPGQSAKYFMGK